MTERRSWGFVLNEKKYIVEIPADVVFPVHALLMDHQLGLANVRIAGVPPTPNEVIYWIPTNQPVLCAYPEGYADPFAGMKTDILGDLL